MKAKTNTPKRVAKDMRKLLRNDVELTHEDRKLRLSEYNYFFNTNYTHEDVFGDKNIKEATKEKLAYYEDYPLLYIDIEDYLPDDNYKKAALTFIVNFLYNDFSEFEEMLDDDVSMVIFKQKSIIGKQAVMEYWKDYRYRIKKEIVRRFEVKFCPYYSATGLYLEIRGYAPVCLLYCIDEGKIKNMVYYFPTDETSRAPDEIVKSLPYTLEEASRHIVWDAKTEANRLPCFHCGKPSEQLEWHWAKYYEDPDSIIKQVSVCPECHCVVETRVEKRFDRGMELEEISPEKMTENEHCEGIKLEMVKADEANEFARKGNVYRNELEKIARGSDKSKNALFRLLPELHLRDSYKVGFAGKDLDEIDGFYYFYVFDSVLNMEKPVYHYVDVNPTPMGVWQLYLLMNSEAFIDFNNQRRLVKPFRHVFDRCDLEKLPELKKRDIRRLEQCNYLFPKVSIKKMEDDGEKYLGEVFCTFWRRNALWLDYRRYMIDNNGKVDWKHSDSSNMLLHRNPGPEIY